MQRLHGGARVADGFRDGVVALGNFDGVHLGHQAVIGRAVERARAEGRPAIVATFDPHPIRHFRAGAEPFHLTTLAQREALFAGLGADASLLFSFDEALARIEADGFVADWLVDRAGAAAVVTGDDFTFGRGREGTPARMAALGLPAETVPPVRDAGGVISSTRIRHALKAGEMGEATRLLTRPYAIEGVVEHGDARGRDLGYPTANVALGEYLRPRYGIYATRARLPQGQVVDGVANLGIRPTFDPPKELLEVHLFDWAGDLYGQVLGVELHAFLRPEARFDRLDALIDQMDRDSAEARALLAALHPRP